MIPTERKEKQKEFLQNVGTKSYRHVKNGTLYDHLIRTSAILEHWQLSDDVVSAGMFHSIYSTQIFRNVVVSIDRRKEVQQLIGEGAERIVHLFSVIDRETLAKSDDGYTFSSHIDKSKITVTEEEVKGLLHIILANQFDHIHSMNTGHHLSILGAYLPWKHLLCGAAKEALEKYAVEDSTTPTDTADYVRFIAHAGLQIKTKGKSILIDPWIYASGFDTPLLQGLDPNERTIDFIIPEPRNNIRDLRADIILLSHFHTHHAPLREITELASMQPITIVSPRLSTEKILVIRQRLGEYIFGRITFRFLDKEEEVTFGNVLVRAYTHTTQNHFAYYVKTKNTSVLHIADAFINEDTTKNIFSPTYNKFDNLRPDFLFVGAAGHNMKIIKSDGVTRDIIENTSFTPIQAAKFAVRVMPKHAATVGMYNQSIWDGRVEGVLSVEDVEYLFFWALNHLAPSIKVHALKPGDVFCL
jgi:hypothetical protein